jgi:hypothetical protein
MKAEVDYWSRSNRVHAIKVFANLESDRTPFARPVSTSPLFGKSPYFMSTLSFSVDSIAGCA